MISSFKHQTNVFPPRDDSGRFSIAGRFAIFALVMIGWADERSASAQPSPAPSDRPNILFILADDQCFETIAALGNDEIETPNLDQLVKRGTTFTHCYNMGSWSGAVCVASRTMLNTGRYLWQAERVYDSSEAERAAGRFWPELMREAGYRTYMTGKWHVKANANAAFDVTADVRGGMPQQTPAGYDRPRTGEPDPWSPSDPQFGGFWEGGKHWSEVVGDHAETFLADAAAQPQPFFMYVAFNAPHDPRQSPQAMVDKYPQQQIRVPENYLAEYPYKDAIGCGPGLRDERLAPFPRTEMAVRVHRQEYYAIITHMDQQIGRVLQALEESGQAENTWIFFTADHGLAVGQHGLMGKQNLYDHSVRVPFIVVGPDVARDTRRDDPVYLQDVMPTTLDLAGVEKPDYVDFQSLLPNLRGESEGGRVLESVYGAYLDLQRSIRTDRYKLIVYPRAKKLRLYDLAADPRELNDLADDPRQSDQVAKLFQQLVDLQGQLDDDLDLAEFFPTLVAGD
jgi:choline-sulfatase